MPGAIMLSFSSLALRRSTTLLFENASFKVYSGQKLGITGANGCGKSSLFALIRGELSPDEGDFSLPADWAVASVEQETRLSEQLALEYVIDGDTELRQTQARLEQAEREQNSTQIAACHERLQEIDGYQAESRAARLLAGLGFADAEMSEPLNRFSGGWIMRLNLARALMCRSDLLLLDEPTNHLDLDAVIWLEQWLQRYRGSLLLISHDRDFLDAVVDSVAHIEEQRITLYRGNYSAFERQRAERLAQQQAAYRKQQESIAHMQRYIDRFRAKATKAKQAQSRIKALERMQLIAPAHVDSPFHFEFRAPAALPSTLIRLRGARTGYDERVVLDGIDFSLIPGERGLRFSHDLVAGSIYGQIPRSRLQAMHRRAAELLEEATARDLELAADLAHHAARSGDPALAGRAMVSAGKLFNAKREIAVIILAVEIFNALANLLNRAGFDDINKSLSAQRLIAGEKDGLDH